MAMALSNHLFTISTPNTVPTSSLFAAPSAIDPSVSCPTSPRLCQVSQPQQSHNGQPLISPTISDFLAIFPTTPRVHSSPHPPYNRYPPSCDSPTQTTAIPFSSPVSSLSGSETPKLPPPPPPPPAAPSQRQQQQQRSEKEQSQQEEHNKGPTQIHLKTELEDYPYMPDMYGEQSKPGSTTTETKSTMRTSKTGLSTTRDTDNNSTCEILEWARKRKEEARQEYKVRAREISGQVIKRRKKGDAPIPKKEQHRRRLAMNQESAAAARHAHEVYTVVLENTVKSQDLEIKRLTQLIRQLQQDTNITQG